MASDDDALSVLIADDHDLVRETIGSFLERDGGYTVSTVATLSDALDAISNSGAFDIVVLDYSMPGMEGLEGLRRAIEANQGKPVALISGLASKTIAENALDMGASGFLPKTLSAKSMINALNFIAAGEIYAPVKWLTETSSENTLHEKLSDRESEVLQGICRGESNKEIARGLGLQEVTVKLHVKTLCRKLGARNRTHAAMIAKNDGLA